MLVFASVSGWLSYKNATARVLCVRKFVDEGLAPKKEKSVLFLKFGELEKFG